jgi:hypothetical protein
MNAQQPTVTVTKPKGVDEKIRSIYVNYMKLMLEAATDEALKQELFTSNEKRLYYLNNEVGMVIPDGVQVVLQTGDLHSPQIFVKNDEGAFFIEEGSAPFSITEKLKDGEVVTDTMTVTTAEEIDLTIHEAFADSKVVLKMPFLDPATDLTLFELKFDDKEIVLSTCAA